MGQKLRQDTLGMLCLCSTMFGTLARKTQMPGAWTIWMLFYSCDWHLSQLIQGLGSSGTDCWSTCGHSKGAVVAGVSREWDTDGADEIAWPFLIWPLKSHSITSAFSSRSEELDSVSQRGMTRSCCRRACWTGEYYCSHLWKIWAATCTLTKAIWTSIILKHSDNRCNKPFSRLTIKLY